MDTSAISGSRCPWSHLMDLKLQNEIPLLKKCPWHCLPGRTTFIPTALDLVVAAGCPSGGVFLLQTFTSHWYVPSSAATALWMRSLKEVAAFISWAFPWKCD